MQREINMDNCERILMDLRQVNKLCTYKSHSRSNTDKARIIRYTRIYQVFTITRNVIRYFYFAASEVKKFINR